MPTRSDGQATGTTGDRSAQTPGRVEEVQRPARCEPGPAHATVGAPGEIPGRLHALGKRGDLARGEIQDPQVEQVLPDWVEEAGGYKRLTIRGFEALAVESLRQLHTENDELRERVARLESLEGELTSLRATIATLVESR